MQASSHFPALNTGVMMLRMTRALEQAVVVAQQKRALSADKSNWPC